MKKLIIMTGIIKRTVLLMAVAFCSASAFAQSWDCGSPTATDVTATLSGGVLTISGTGAMENYTEAAAVPWNGETVTSIVIGSGITSIGNYAFGHNVYEDFTDLTSVDFSAAADLQTIGDRAFQGCTALTAVDLLETGVTSIGNFAFNGCTALESVDFPTTLQTIGAVAFQSCALVSVDLSGTVLTSIGDWGAFASCTALESVTFPDTLTSLGHNAFSGCTALTSVDLSGTGVSIIKMQTFSGCTSLTTVTFPATLTSIEGSAFNNCTALTSVTSFNSTPPALGSAVFTEIAPGCTLTVPAGAKALYEVADGWKDFGTVKEQGVIANPNPIRNSRGTFNVSLSIPSEGTFTATFDVTLPPKFTLNAGATKLAEDLAGSYTLKITDKGNGVWSFEIAPNGLRSASTTSFREAVNVVYTVEKTLEDGDYILKINDMILTLSDGTVIRDDEITIPVHFDSATGNETVGEAASVICYGDVLSVNSPPAEQIEVYSVSGALLYRAQKASGKATFRLNHLPKGVLIVKGGSGWVKKVIN